MNQLRGLRTYIAACEIASLDHEVIDDAVEVRVFVPELLAAGTGVANAELSEIVGGLGDDAVVELELEAALLHLTGQSISIG